MVHIKKNNRVNGSSSYTVIGSRSWAHEQKNMECYPTPLRLSDSMNTTVKTASALHLRQGGAQTS